MSKQRTALRLVGTGQLRRSDKPGSWVLLTFVGTLDGEVTRFDAVCVGTRKECERFADRMPSKPEEAIAIMPIREWNRLEHRLGERLTSYAPAFRQPPHANAADPHNPLAYVRSQERARQNETVRSMLENRIALLEAGRPVEHFGVALAQAFSGCRREDFVKTLRSVMSDLVAVAQNTGMDPQPFRGEVQAWAVYEFDRLSLLAGSAGIGSA
jgi:hypothetical protein